MKTFPSSPTQMLAILAAHTTEDLEPCIPQDELDTSFQHPEDLWSAVYVRPTHGRYSDKAILTRMIRVLAGLSKDVLADYERPEVIIERAAPALLEMCEKYLDDGNKHVGKHQCHGCPVFASHGSMCFWDIYDLQDHASEMTDQLKKILKDL